MSGCVCVPECLGERLLYLCVPGGLGVFLCVCFPGGCVCTSPTPPPQERAYVSLSPGVWVCVRPRCLWISLSPGVCTCPVCLPDVWASLHVSPHVWLCVPLLGLCGCGNSSFLLRQSVGERRQQAVPRPERDDCPAAPRSPRPSCPSARPHSGPTRPPETLTLARPTLALPAAPARPRGASALHSPRGHTEDARGGPGWPVRVQRGEKVGDPRTGDRSSSARVQLQLLTSSTKGTTWRRAGAGPGEAEPGPGARGGGASRPRYGQPSPSLPVCLSSR